jgi:uncharacterized membrane protein YqjE
VSDAPPPASSGSAGDGANASSAPPLTDAAKQLGDDALELGRSAWSALRGFRTLFAADLSLSRSAFGLTLAYAGAAIALGASAWLLLMALGVLALHAWGLSWIASVAIPALISLAGAAFFVWQATQVFVDTRLDATRRQLARLGLGEDPIRIEREPERLP